MLRAGPTVKQSEAAGFFGGGGSGEVLDNIAVLHPASSVTLLSSSVVENAVPSAVLKYISTAALFSSCIWNGGCHFLCIYAYWSVCVHT